MSTLYPFQVDCLAALAQHWNEGARGVVVVSPTGSGKSTMAAHVAHGRRALFVTPGREISADFKARMPALQLDASRVDVMTIQELAARGIADDYEVVIADEAHHLAPNAWTRALEKLRYQHLVGFTATPERGDGKPLGDMFDCVVSAPSTRELIAAGYLCHVDIFAPERASKGLAEHPVEAVARHCRGLRTFLFAPSAAHAKVFAAELCARGVPAAAITSATGSAERARSIRAFERGEIRVIANYATMTEGVNIEAADCAVIARRCSHVGMFVQMCGRVLRRNGTKRARVLDLAGNVALFGDPTSEMKVSLQGTAITLSGGDSTGVRPSEATAPSKLLVDPRELVTVVSTMGVGIGAGMSAHAALVDEPARDLAARDIARARGFDEQWVADVRETRGALATGFDWELSYHHAKTCDRCLTKLRDIAYRTSPEMLACGLGWFCGEQCKSNYFNRIDHNGTRAPGPTSVYVCGRNVTWEDAAAALGGAALDSFAVHFGERHDDLFPRHYGKRKFKTPLFVGHDSIEYLRAKADRGSRHEGPTWPRFQQSEDS